MARFVGCSIKLDFNPENIWLFSKNKFISVKLSEEIVSIRDFRHSCISGDQSLLIMTDVPDRKNTFLCCEAAGAAVSPTDNLFWHYYCQT